MHGGDRAAVHVIEYAVVDIFGFLTLRVHVVFNGKEQFNVGNGNDRERKLLRAFAIVEINSHGGELRAAPMDEIFLELHNFVVLVESGMMQFTLHHPYKQL